MMLRVLFCISCCSPHPSSRAKRRSGSSQQLKGSERSSRQDVRERKVSQESKAGLVGVASEKNRSLASQLETLNSGEYGATETRSTAATKDNESQGKIILPLGAKNAEQNYDRAMIERGDSFTASTSATTRLKRANALYYSSLSPSDIERLRELGADFRNSDNEDDNAGDQDVEGGSISPPSSIDVGPFIENTTSETYTLDTTIQRPQSADARAQDSSSAYQQQVSDNAAAAAAAAAAYDVTNRSSASRTPDQRYVPLASTVQNVPSTTKIGDYARIEYSPIEDLDSLTTMSHSRLGSERGGSRKNQAGSTLSRQSSLKAHYNDEGVSRRSSHGGIESTSISIASQLSNEQFQQNLTNMLESVNSNYPNIGTIGLPLGPPLEGLMTETTKTSPETPGAALTSASQDSLSDVAFDEISPVSSRPGTLRSNASVGAALVGGETMDRSSAPEDMAELAQPAPLASAEDEDGQQSYPSANTTRLGGERVDTPASMATTASGGLTNPTPTPSEMSGGSGKKKRSKAKSLLKKLKPGGKKSKGDAK